jgi:haloacetate dehalogenase
MFEGFESKTVTTSGATIRALVGGSGPPLLLLHGYPQTHAMWHKLAPRFAERFTVVAADLRGYGDSSKPPGGDKHENYAKRAMALDQVELMQKLGFSRFRLVGHDRGGRVAHRLALDHPAAVSHVAVLDIAPTATMYAKTDSRFATAYFHWFFLIQPFDLPERLIGSDPDYYLMRNWRKAAPGIFTDDAVAEYKRCFRDPATIHASCEDYRAAAGIDLEHDAADADRRIECPFLVLWGEQGVVGKLFDPLNAWREKAVDVAGQAIACGHYLAEEAPDVTLAALLDFLGK